MRIFYYFSARLVCRTFIRVTDSPLEIWLPLMSMIRIQSFRLVKNSDYLFLFSLIILLIFNLKLNSIKGGVGFDINCGVRLIRTNLDEKDVQPVKEQLAQSLFDHIPVGVGSKGIIPMNARDFEECLEMGMDWTLREGYSWAEDKEHCEEYGRMLTADPQKVSARAKKRGLPQVCP